MSYKLIKASDAVGIVVKYSELYGDGEVSTDKGEQILYAIVSDIINLPSAEPDGEYISQQAVTESDLIDWYINSVDECEPVWTEEHIYELFNDFYLIPKENR